MKKFYCFLGIVLLLNAQIIKANIGQLDCTASGTTSWNGQIGGYALPSEGTINVLFIFAQFPDDNYDISNHNLGKRTSAYKYAKLG